MDEQNPVSEASLGVSEEGRKTRPSVSEARREILGDDTLLSVGEVALLVGCSKRQIYAMIHRHTFPGPRKIGALSRWRLGIIRNWLRADDLRRC
jgi:excisionase family DNA binding protein